MIIPVTDKIWQQLKFDENFNEISYVDNRGLSFEFIDPIKGHLKFYKADGIDISQELLENIKHIKSDNKDEQLFIKLFSSLLLIKIANYPCSLFFKQKHGNKIIAEYAMYNKIFWINYYEIWSHFNMNRIFFGNMVEKCLKLNVLKFSVDYLIDPSWWKQLQ